MTDLIGKYEEKPFPKIQNSVGDIFEFSRSKYYVLGLVEADVTVAQEIIEQHKVKTGESLSFTGWIAKCLAQTITEYPMANSYRKGRNRVITFKDVDIAKAVLYNKNLYQTTLQIIHNVSPANNYRSLLSPNLLDEIINVCTNRR